MAASAWLAVSDDLLWGFNHALSNRLAALASIAKILEHSDTGLDPLLSALSDEIDTLERTLGLLRLIPRDPEAGPEPIRLEDLLPDVVRLQEFRGGARELECDLRFDGDPQPVWMERSPLAHALVIALEAGYRAAAGVGAMVVGVRVVSREDAVAVEVRPAGAAGPGETSLIESLIAPAGGVFQQVGDGEGGTALRLEFPTLLAVRARERAGASGGAGPGSSEPPADPDATIPSSF